MGAYLLLYPRAKVLTLVVLIVFFTFWWLPAWVFLGYWFVLQFLSGAQTIGQTGQETGGVAVWAHVGGFVAGLILVKVSSGTGEKAAVCELVNVVASF